MCSCSESPLYCLCPNFGDLVVDRLEHSQALFEDDFFFRDVLRWLWSDKNGLGLGGWTPTSIGGGWFAEPSAVWSLPSDGPCSSLLHGRSTEIESEFDGSGLFGALKLSSKGKCMSSSMRGSSDDNVLHSISRPSEVFGWKALPIARM
jgi:hypothetical protein